MRAPRAREGKSPLLGWMVGIFLFFQALSIVHALVTFFAAEFLTDFLTGSSPVKIATSCMGLVNWAVPILAILLLARRRAQHYQPGVSVCAITALVEFCIKFVINIVWVIAIMPDILRAARSGANANTAAYQAVTNHLGMLYAIQVANLLVSAIAAWVVLKQLGRMQGVHWQLPPREQNDDGDEEPRRRRKADYAPDEDWDRSQPGGRHDRNR